MRKTQWCACHEGCGGPKRLEPSHHLFLAAQSVTSPRQVKQLASSGSVVKHQTTGLGVVTQITGRGVV